MKRNTKIETLFGCVILEDDLSTKTLNSYGLTPKDLKDFKDLHFLESTKRGEYTFIAYEKLHEYGKKLEEKGEHEEASLCFQKCRGKMNSDSYKEFLKRLKEGKYRDALNLFKKALEIGDVKNMNYLLYLLSILIELPQELAECLNGILLPDILENGANNDSRIAAWKKKFSQAVHLQNKLLESCSYTREEDIVINALLSQIFKIQKENAIYILNLVKNNQHETLVEFLEKKSHLNKQEEYVLALAKKYLEINRTGKVPIKGELSRPDSINDAIYTNNFEKALEINTNFIQKINRGTEENVLNILLAQICELIKKVQISNSEATNIDRIQKPIIESTFANLKLYLTEIGKPEYEFIIADLIKISLLEHDETFSKPKNFLIELKNSNAPFNMSKYVQEFYNALTSNSIEVARLYLSILDRANVMHNYCLLLDGLHEMFDRAVKKANFIKQNAPVTPVKEPIQECVTNPLFDKLFNHLEMLTTPISIEDYVNSQVEEVIANKGIAILKAEDDVRTQKIEELIKSNKDVASFRIESPYGTQVVLKYSQINEYIDFKTLMLLGSQAYNDEDYTACIEYYSKLVRFFREPNIQVFSLLGLSYYKLGRIEEAIKYLTVAECISKQRNIKSEIGRAHV